jgi:diaminopimelate epimerase
MKFTKMHGCGNDYVYVNCFEEKVENPQQIAPLISNRHFGIGSDGLVLICPPENPENDCAMHMYNPDGSEAEMCGNATRCVGKYVHDRGIVPKDVVRMESLAGVKVIHIECDSEGKAEMLTVDMGEPILEPATIPVSSEDIMGVKLTSHDREFDFTCVSMGNPHAVAFIEDKVEDFAVEKYGPVLEVADVFPRKANIEFVNKIDETHLAMRVWERGTGETLACGTGTCATVVAAILNGVCKKDTKVEVKLVGGILTIEWKSEDNHVYMTGPATVSFDGEWYN